MTASPTARTIGRAGATPISVSTTSRVVTILRISTMVHLDCLVAEHGWAKHGCKATLVARMKRSGMRESRISARIRGRPSGLQASAFRLLIAADVNAHAPQLSRKLPTAAANKIYLSVDSGGEARERGARAHWPGRRETMYR